MGNGEAAGARHEEVPGLWHRTGFLLLRAAGAWGNTSGQSMGTGLKLLLLSCHVHRSSTVLQLIVFSAWLAAGKKRFKRYPGQNSLSSYICNHLASNASKRKKTAC